MFKRPILSLIAGLFSATTAFAQPQLVGPLDARNNLSEIAGNGSTAQGTARTNLGLGSIATQGANSVAITGGSIAGTDASNALSTSTGSSTARTFAARSADLINVKDGYGSQPGAKGDAKIATPVVTLSGTSLTVGSALFASTDVGKSIVIAGGSVGPATAVVVSTPVLTPGSGYTSVPAVIYNDAASSGTGATAISLLALQSATITTGGTGCTNGTAYFQAGIDGTGSPAQISGTVSGGVLTGPLTIVTGGLQSTLGTITGASIYGDNCATPPIVSLSYGVAAIQITAQGTAYTIGQTTAALSGGSPSVSGTLGTPQIGNTILPPLISTIASYTSPTQVTLTDSAGTAITGVATRILWGTDDHVAFANAALTGSGIWIPSGTYWIGNNTTGGTIDPGTSMFSVRGEGMQNTILVFNNGMSTSQDSGNWTPLFKNTQGSASARSGNVQFEDFQIRGLLDFGQINIGGPAIEINFHTEINIDRVKFYQIPWMSMQNEAVSRFTVTNSIFDTTMRDQARCRGCFSNRIIGNKFIHADDDSVALHQGIFGEQGPGLVRESIVVEGNDFEDTPPIHILGARTAVIRGNTFRRPKLWAVNLSSDAGEGVNQLRGLIIADNIAEDVITRLPYTTTTTAPCVFCVSVLAPSAPTGVTSFYPGSAEYPSGYFGKPWDFDLANVTNASVFGPAAKGVEIHDNLIMRTLPASANYSAYGFGKMLTITGMVDPPIPDTVLRPTAGISASVNVSGLHIHDNDVRNVRRGITLNDVAIVPSQINISVNFNHIFDAWEYGIVGFGTGNFASFDMIGNQIDVDPYLVSPGRSGSNGSWTSNYAASQCFSWNYTSLVRMAYNTFSDCYSIANNTAWIKSKNVIRGSPNSANTGQILTWSANNLGIGIYPPVIGDEFYILNVTSNPTANPPLTYGVATNVHPTSAIAAPTSGYHVIGDYIMSSRPDTCACVGWVAITTGSSWVAGTDYKVMPLQ